MRKAAFELILLAAVAGTSEAQGRGRGNSAQGIPPGQMPRAGECRVWHDSLPPGRQPAPTNCDQAERVASRNRNARVIYGDDRLRRATATSAIAIAPRVRRVIRRSTARIRTTAVTATTACRFENGYRDGSKRAARTRSDNDSYDPVRHSWYRSGDRGYNSRYGTRDDYKLVVS